MAPSTRAEARRPGKAVRLQSTSLDGVTAIDVTCDRSKTKCLLLKLPPELRNRIYHFTQDHMHEDPVEDSKEIDPRYGVNTWEQESGGRPYPPLSHHRQCNSLCSLRHQFDRLRRPLALAQTCRQLRAEYRPFWLTRSRFHVPVDDLAAFIRAFYPTQEDFKHAPAELYISYGYYLYEQPPEPIDLTLVVLLRAYSPGFRCVFRSAKMLESHRHECSVKYCAPMQCQHDEFFKYAYGLLEGMAFVEAFESLINNNTEAWVKDVKKSKYAVKCAFDKETYNVRFDIVLKESVEQVCDLLRHAQTLLKRFISNVRQRPETKSGQGTVENVVEIPSKAGDDDQEWFTAIA